MRWRCRFLHDLIKYGRVVLHFELQDVEVLVRMQVLAPDRRLDSSDSPRQCLQSGAYFKLMVRISARFPKEVPDFVVIERSHHGRVAQMPLRGKLRLRRRYCRHLVDLYLVLIDGRRIVHLELLALNVDMIALRLLLSFHLVWSNLGDWVDFSLALRSNLVLLLILN